MPRSRNLALSRAERLNHVEEILYNAPPSGLVMIEIAQRCGVNRSTIWRDIRALSEKRGVPVWNDGSRYGILRERYVTSVRLNLHEATALFLAARLLTRYSDTHHPHVARYALDGPVLPRLQDTIYVAEIARRYVQGFHGRKFGKAWSPLFSGKQADGEKREDGHAHAFYLPLDNDDDGRLDQLLIVAPQGLTLEELKTLSVFRQMHGPGGMDVNLMLLEVCPLESATLWQSARRWRSVTPFVATRHYKERGTKRDTFPRERLGEMVLREELARRGLPAPIDIQPLAERELLRAGRKLPWREFRQHRVMGNGQRGADFGKGFVIEFAENVPGPIALGYACHFGLGLFVPA